MPEQLPLDLGPLLLLTLNPKQVRTYRAALLTAALELERVLPPLPPAGAARQRRRVMLEEREHALACIAALARLRSLMPPPPAVDQPTAAPRGAATLRS